LKAFYKEKVKYILGIKSQTINIIPGSKFLQFMYHLESLVIELFERHSEIGPNILCYIRNNLLSKLHLNQMFVIVLKSSTQEIDIKLKNKEFRFIYKKCISIYMKSHQKT